MNQRLKTLYRPVGLYEPELIWDSGMREFPPRLPHQPIFYPVADLEYAQQIARDWNTLDPKSGFSGFVTAFSLNANYISNFEEHRGGSSLHLEYWIPAEELRLFNSNVCGRIDVEEGFFGADFQGYMPDHDIFKERDAVGQFISLLSIRDPVLIAVGMRVPSNRKAAYLNCLFWARHDFSGIGISNDQRDAAIQTLKFAWEPLANDIPLPKCL